MLIYFASISCFYFLFFFFVTVRKCTKERMQSRMLNDKLYTDEFESVMQTHFAVQMWGFGVCVKRFSKTNFWFEIESFFLSPRLEELTWVLFVLSCLVLFCLVFYYFNGCYGYDLAKRRNHFLWLVLRMYLLIQRCGDTTERIAKGERKDAGKFFNVQKRKGRRG